MRLSVSYTKAINKRYSRVGPLFQGAFQAKHINQDAYLRRIIEYIHQNPVKGVLVQFPQDREHSSCRIHQGLKDAGNLKKHLKY